MIGHIKYKWGMVYIAQDKKEKRECPYFDSFGSDLKEARKNLGFSRRALSDIVRMDYRYLAHIENDGFIPALPLFYDLVTTCKLQAAKYFNQATDSTDDTISEARKRVLAKVDLCPEKHLPVIEGALDGAIQDKTKETENE